MKAKTGRDEYREIAGAELRSVDTALLPRVLANALPHGCEPAHLGDGDLQGREVRVTEEYAAGRHKSI